MYKEGTPCVTLRRFMLVTHFPWRVQPGSFDLRRLSTLSPRMRRDTSVKWPLVQTSHWKYTQTITWHTALFFFFPYSDNHVDSEQHRRLLQRQPQTDWLHVGPQHPELGAVETPSPDASSHHFCHYTPKCFLTLHRGEWHMTRLQPAAGVCAVFSKIWSPQEDREHQSCPLRHDTERRVGMKAPRRPQSELRMRWRHKERPTTTRWVFLPCTSSASCFIELKGRRERDVPALVTWLNSVLSRGDGNKCDQTFAALAVRKRRQFSEAWSQVKLCTFMSNVNWLFVWTDCICLC